MELVNEFTVPAPLDEAWDLLTDVSRIGPCLPGASVQHLGEDKYSGAVSVKVGPIKVAYNGEAAFRSLDAEAHRMVLDARGSERTGKGSASAVITVDLRPSGDAATDVHVSTDLQVTGKVAQFGRSAMRDVSGRLLDQFADNLAGLLTSGGEPTDPQVTPRAAASAAAAVDAAVDAGVDAAEARPAPVPVSAPAALHPVAAAVPTEPADADLDVLALLAAPAKRFLVPAAVFVLGAGLGVLLGRRRSPGRPPRTAWDLAAAGLFEQPRWDVSPGARLAGTNAERRGCACS